MGKQAIKRLMTAVMNANSRFRLEERVVWRVLCDALQAYLMENFGINQTFDVHVADGVLHAFKYTSSKFPVPIEEAVFDLSRLGRIHTANIIERFQAYLDNADTVGSLQRLTPLIGDIVYGRVVKYIDDTAYVEFEDSQNNTLTGECSLRHLLPDERNALSLLNLGKSVWYIRRFHITQTSLQILLSRKTIQIPELSLRRAILSHGLDMFDFNFKCVRRIAGKRSLIVSVGRIPVTIYRQVNDELGKEALRILSVKSDSPEAKLFHKGELSFIEIAEKYVNLSTMKDKVNE